MIAYRVYTERGFTEFLELPLAQIYHAEFGVGDIEEIPIEQPKWNAEAFKKQLSDVFDAKFETYCSAKGYIDMFDLLSHGANPYSQYHLEALSLLNWWHTEWNDITQNINEQSNIEDIINNLNPYNG